MTAGAAQRRSADRQRWSARLSTALIVLAAVLLVVANVGYWFTSTILDSNEFTSRVEGVLRRPEAAERIGDVLAQQALSSGEVQEQITQALPEDAEFLPVLIEGQLQDVISGALARVVMLDAARDIVATAIRELHDLVVSTLEGRRDGLAVEGDALVLRLGGVVSNFLERLGVSSPKRIQEADAGTIVLVEDVKALDQASGLVRGIEDAVPVVFIGSVIGFAASVAMSRNRPRGLRAVGYAVVIAGVASLIAWRLTSWGSSAYLDERPVARMMIDSLASNLRLQSIGILLVGAVLVLAADERSRDWITSRSSAVMTRVEAFGTGRAVLIVAAAITLLLLIS